MVYLGGVRLAEDIWERAETHGQLSKNKFMANMGTNNHQRVLHSNPQQISQLLIYHRLSQDYKHSTVLQYFLSMIFSSISREMNHNYHPPTSPKQQRDHPTAQFFQRDNSNTYNLHKTMDYQVPQRESALSQMNQKITQSIEFHKYKEYIKQKDLHSSRISNTSNHSRRSLKTLHSQNDSRVSMQSPSRGSHILTKKSEHYFPQLLQTKLPQKPWQAQPRNVYEPVQMTPTYQQRSSEYRQFLRKPITIDNYNEKYGLNKKYENSTSSKQDTVKRMVYKSNLSQHSKIQDYPPSRPESQFSQQTFASPIRKDFTNIFDKQPKLKPQGLLNTQYSNQTEKSSSRVVFRQQNQNSQNLTKRSPLEVSQKNNRSAMITAAGLIGLGIVLLLLQALK